MMYVRSTYVHTGDRGSPDSDGSNCLKAFGLDGNLFPNPDERCSFERQKFAYSDNEVTEYECFTFHSVSGKNTKNPLSDDTVYHHSYEQIN